MPSVQKKTGAVAGDLKTGEKGVPGSKTNGKAPNKRKAVEESADVKVEPTPPKKVNGKGRGKKASEVDPVKAEEEDALPAGKPKKRKAVLTPAESTGGRRGSGRVFQK